MSNLTEALKELTKLINLEAIETKDLVSEMQSLYDQVEEAEGRLRAYKQKVDDKSSTIIELRRQVRDLEEDYKIPQEQIKQDKQKLDRERFEFETEKKYLHRENHQLREILSSAISRTRIEQGTYGDGGGYRNEIVEKPRLGNP